MSSDFFDFLMKVLVLPPWQTRATFRRSKTNVAAIAAEQEKLFAPNICGFLILDEMIKCSFGSSQLIYSAFIDP